MEPEVNGVPEVSVETVVEKRPNAMVRAMSWLFLGAHGLRFGWTVFLFFMFTGLFMALLGMIYSLLHLTGSDTSFTALHTIVNLMMMVPAMAGSAWLLAKINRHRFDAYNIADKRLLWHLAIGLLGGFAAVSGMIGILYAGRLLKFGGGDLTGFDIAKYAALWGVAFLLVGFNEEGMFRCFLQKVFSESFTFMTALITFVVIDGILCLTNFLGVLKKTHDAGKAGQSVVHWLTGNPMMGVYLLFGLGLVFCVTLIARKSEGRGFWYAAWIGSTLFGLVHTGNGGENWIGIFSAGAIGFIFCVGIYYTGSVWWAIGFHAAWDWGLTYFYGAADSGNPAAGHFLSVSPMGNELLSGGADGPEGSVLIIPLLVVILAVLYVVWGRKKNALPATEESAA
jgi:membrane protease YdiL (CAAX protease family)